MGKELVNYQEHFVKKSNVIVRAVTNQSAGIVTQRLFNFAILSVKKDKDNFKGKIRFLLSDFCKYYEINSYTLYDKVIQKKQEMTVIQKEIQNITQMQFWLMDEYSGDFKFVNLFLEGGLSNGFVEFLVNKDLTKKYYLDIKKDYTNIYLPYTKEVTSKYSMRLYEYLRSYLYINAKTQGIPSYRHEWDFEKLAKILNLTLNHSYFKKITNLKFKILEPVKKDLAKTDIIFDYQLIKVGRKFSKIILRTVLDKKKFLAQNYDDEKTHVKDIKTKFDYKSFSVNQKKETLPNDYVDNSDEYNYFTKTENRLSQEEIKQILEKFDNH